MRETCAQLTRTVARLASSFGQLFQLGERDGELADSEPRPAQHVNQLHRALVEGQKSKRPPEEHGRGRAVPTDERTFTGHRQPLGRTPGECLRLLRAET